jgi:hypothetical protein
MCFSEMPRCSLTTFKKEIIKIKLLCSGLRAKGEGAGRATALPSGKPLKYEVYTEIVKKVYNIKGGQDGNHNIYR